MDLLTFTLLFCLCLVSAKSDDKSGVTDVLSQNLTAVWDALSDLTHRVHDLEEHGHGEHGHHDDHHKEHAKHHGEHDDHHEEHGNHHGQHGSGHGYHDTDKGSHRHTGHGAHADEHYRKHADISNIMEELGITDMGWGYVSPFVKSSHMVKTNGEEAAGFAVAHSIFIKRHFTGFPFSSYDDDTVLAYNAGGNVKIHVIHVDGRHELQVLGDVRQDPSASFMVIIPGGAHQAMELDGDTGDFALITFISAPEYDRAKFHSITADKLVAKYPVYENMIRRLNDIRKDDVAIKSGNHTHTIDLRSDERNHGHQDNHDDKPNTVDASLFGSFTWERSENMDAWRKAVRVPGLAWTKDNKVSISVHDGVYTMSYTSAEGTTSSSTFRLGEEVVEEFQDQEGQDQVRKTTTRELNGKLVTVSKVIDGGEEREYTKTREFTPDGMTMSMEFGGVVGRHYFIRD